MPHRLSLTRRRALGAMAVGLGGLAASACDLRHNDAARRTARDAAPPGDPSSSSRPGSASTTDVPAGDEHLRDEVVAAVATAHRLVHATRGAHSDLAGPLHAFERLHARHLSSLGAPHAHGRSVSVPGDRDAAQKAVLKTESRLQDRLVEAAVAAESGPFAARLASMAAAVAQLRSEVA